MLIETLGAIAIAACFCLACSALDEPARKRFNAVFVAGAGAAYLHGATGALGLAEFAFTALVCFCAFKGLSSYRWIAAAWMLHVIWDVVHHAVGEPIVGFDPLSSLGCAICDTLLAVWFYVGAPSWLRRARAVSPVAPP